MNLAPPKPPKPIRRVSRARLRVIVAGTAFVCSGCYSPIKFDAQKRKAQRVVCNVYIRRVWDRVEHYHLHCYLEIGSPYGIAQTDEDTDPADTGSSSKKKAKKNKPKAAA